MGISREKLFSAVDAQQKEMINQLEILVNTDSGSYSLDGVNRVAELLSAYFSQIGFSIERLKSPQYASHVRAVKHGRGGENILLMGHMDTVFPEGTASQRPFRIDGKKAYGPGVCDMKSGLVCMLYGLRALFEQNFDNYGTITVLLNTDEERGSATSRVFIEEEGRKADLAVVLEAGMKTDYVVIQRQGGGIFEMEIKGKPAHAGANPQDGVHAIEELAHKILDLHSLTDYSCGKMISVGVVNGGYRSNIIPEQVKAEIDLRCNTQPDGEDLIRKMQEISSKSTVPGTTCTISEISYRPPIEKTPGNVKLFECMKRAGSSLGKEIKEEFSGGGTDGNYTSALGTPTIDSVGPEGAGEHTDDEFIFIDSLFERTKLFAAFLAETTGA
jgi:glutamate carboxypeptidase